MTRDAIALFLEVPDRSFDVTIEPVLPRDIEADLKAANGARSRADKAGREAMEAVRRVTRRLHDEAGLTVRDVGAILGVSHQRAQQLLHDSPREAAGNKRSSAARVRSS
jgi:hypothetical protein